MLQLIPDVLQLSHCRAKRPKFGALLIEHWKAKRDLFISNEMIYQPEDTVVDRQHMWKPLLLFFNSLLKGSERTFRGLNEVFCD